ncbi:hypothetical protein PROFUN_04297 [Planoprotostelium fungivorum]|uniref:Glycoprotein endo-alpha-1,2-mannosidase n=1 Tax=Planoprotostelium fungivorum TaxID=1890364 RepID=A0A2P6NV20_9EUKA|nr:hypothetical protein PROFUN_04297 [Planoprotostelium fungivorum]
MRKRTRAFFVSFGLALLFWIFSSISVELVRARQEAKDLDDLKKMDNKPPIGSNVIGFYYGWYGNPQSNGRYYHWNHEVLVNEKDPLHKFYEPPEDIGADFYPELGLYSSHDEKLIDKHMRQMRDSGIRIVCISWWGNRNADRQLGGDKGYTDRGTRLLLDAADRYDMKIALHHEPYDGRSTSSVKEDLQYIVQEYGSHGALYRRKEAGNLPVLFVYDPYHIQPKEWSDILTVKGKNSIRGTTHDAILISLIVEKRDELLMTDGGFDGCYTYFATDGFTYGSTTANWPDIAAFTRTNEKIFVPSVGPGYADMRIRPWNGKNQRSREDGRYYDRMWESALSLVVQGDLMVPGMISVTSFNEWHEGTQIEPAVPKTSKKSGFKYLDYGELSPDHYLKRTLHFATKYDEKRGDR